MGIICNLSGFDNEIIEAKLSTEVMINKLIDLLIGQSETGDLKIIEYVSRNKY